MHIHAKNGTSTTMSKAAHITSTHTDTYMYIYTHTQSHAKHDTSKAAHVPQTQHTHIHICIHTHIQSHAKRDTSTNMSKAAHAIYIYIYIYIYILYILYIYWPNVSSLLRNIKLIAFDLAAKFLR
jgi:hypothetical protein